MPAQEMPPQKAETALDPNHRAFLMILTALATTPLLFALLQSPPPDPAEPKPQSEAVEQAKANGDQPAAQVVAESKGPFVVEVVGKDFRWHFQVKEPASGKVSNVLRLPAGSTVHWKLTSADYIYAFRIPELNVNMMAVPRIDSSATTENTSPLTVDLLVDPLCNFRLYHDEWMGRVEINETDSKKTEDRS